MWRSNLRAETWSRLYMETSSCLEHRESSSVHAGVAEDALRDAGAVDGRKTVRCTRDCHAEPKISSGEGRDCGWSQVIHVTTKTSSRSTGHRPNQQTLRCPRVSPAIRAATRNTVSKSGESELLGDRSPSRALRGIDLWESRFGSEGSRHGLARETDHMDTRSGSYNVATSWRSQTATGRQIGKTANNEWRNARHREGLEKFW